MARSIAPTAGSRTDRAGPAAVHPGMWLGTAAIAAAWLVLVFGPIAGLGGALDHHALVAGGPPTPAALPGFLVGWSLMVVAMMLPASLPALVAVRPGRAGTLRPWAAHATILGSYLITWGALGLVAFITLAGIRSAVSSVPWLGANPWLVIAAALLLAGTYQLSPLKRRALAACRHPVLRSVAHRHDLPGLGFGHALDSVACSWSLMLALLVAGIGDPWWMAGLAGLMAYETIGREGPRAATIAGRLMLGGAGLVLLIGWLPGANAA